MLCKSRLDTIERMVGDENNENAGSESPQNGGTLVLVGTPLGNRGDLSPRAREAVFSADLLLCEDTRSPLRLFSQDEICRLPRRMSCFVGNEYRRVPFLLDQLRSGKRVAFLSEAGMPVWSDPGQILVTAAAENGFEVDAIPGPSAGTLALALSGFSATGSCFWGFVARSGKNRQLELGRVVEHPGPSIFYEAGNRVPKLLTDLCALLPRPQERKILVARELTKRNQELVRGSVATLASTLTEGLRGEVTVVLSGPLLSDSQETDPVQEAARKTLEVLLDPTIKPRARARALAELTGEDAKAIYSRIAAHRTAPPGSSMGED